MAEVGCGRIHTTFPGDTNIETEARRSRRFPTQTAA